MCARILDKVRDAKEEDVRESDELMKNPPPEGEGDSSDLRRNWYDKGVVVRKTAVQDEATAVILEKLRDAGMRDRRVGMWDREDSARRASKRWCKTGACREVRLASFMSSCSCPHSRLYLKRSTSGTSGGNVASAHLSAR